VFAQTREQARQISCMGNTRQLMAATLLYTQDYDEKLPVLGTGVDSRGRWMWQIKSYVKNLQVFACPHTPKNTYDGSQWTDRTGYGWAEHLWAHNYGTPQADGYGLAEISKPADTICIGDTGFDGAPGWAMYRRDPRDLTYTADDRPGYFPQFRHNMAQSRAFKDNQTGGTRQMPIDGLCVFAFLDGHAKALKPGVAFQKATTEDGIALSGGDQYVLWNRY